MTHFPRPRAKGGQGGMNRTTLARRYAPLAIALAVQLLIIVTAPSTGPSTVAAGNTASAAVTEAGSANSAGAASATEPGTAGAEAAAVPGDVAGGATTRGAAPTRG